jgi:hypothetical protein
MRSEVFLKTSSSITCTASSASSRITRLRSSKRRTLRSSVRASARISPRIPLAGSMRKGSVPRRIPWCLMMAA